MTDQTQPTIELLPCPFCGGAARFGGDFVDGFSVYCIKCECTTPDCDPSYSISERQKAIEHIGQLWNTRAALAEKHAKPIDMVMHCPRCHAQHIDRDEWRTKPHKTHLCEHCGNLWRPCAQPTCGVEALAAQRLGLKIMCNYQYSTWECRGDGYLWDADLDGYEPDEKDNPCPRCNTAEYLNRGAEDARGGGAGSYQFVQYSAASVWRDCMDIAIQENPDVAYPLLASIGPIETDDFADLDNPNYKNTVCCIVVPPALAAQREG